MTEASYWGQDFRARPIATDPRVARVILRSRALGGLGELPPELALPALEELAEKYPNKEAVALPESEYQFEDGAGFLIQQEIWEVKNRAGMDVGPSPRALYWENVKNNNETSASAAE
jgi:hypothetical protein